ncbi:MAG: recombination protein RecR [Deltaproteobacteria bacterium]|nr:recombination protein RecR [Deltaproteobacteria bacterium]
MGTGADPITRLIHELGKLPGIGERTATRLAFHVMRAPESLAQGLAQALLDVKAKVRLCSSCMNLTEDDPCALCADARRDPGLLCVVATPADLLAVDRGGAFRGRYHVLHGVLSPLEGIGPDDLRIGDLVRRLRDAEAASGGTAQPIREVILALSPNVEGEATALYLARLLRPLGPRVTRIASGVPIGGELEYVDQVTIARALEARREV